MASRPHVPWRNGQNLHRQAERLHLPGQARAEGRDKPFAGRIHDLVRQPHAPTGTKVHDERRAVSAQRRQQQARETRHEAVVQVDGAVDVGGRVRREGLERRRHHGEAADVVDQDGDVQMAHRGGRVLQSGRVVCDRVHDEDADLCGWRLALQGGLRGFELVALVSEEDHVEALGAEGLGESEAEPVARAGDESPGGGAVLVCMEGGPAEVGVEEAGDAVEEVDGCEEAEEVYGRVKDHCRLWLAQCA